MKAIIVLSLSAALLCGPAVAQELTAEEKEYLAALEEALPGTLLNIPFDPKWQTFGDDVSTRVVSADIPGEQAFRVKVNRTKPNPYGIAVQGEVTSPIAADDVILVAFWARAQTPDKQTGSGHVQFRLQKSTAPYTGIVEGDVLLRENWQLHYLNGVAGEDYKAGSVNVSFNVGHHRQTIELGQYYIMNMGPGMDPANLPSGSVDP